MSPDNFDGLMPIVIFMAAAVIVFWGGHFVSLLISSKKPSVLKQTAYECGEIPVGNAWSMFNIRFYVVGLIFIIFDVESVLMFPVAAIFNNLNQSGNGVYALIIFLSFISVLLEGIAYCWKKGDLDWVRSYQVNRRATKTEERKEVA